MGSQHYRRKRDRAGQVGQLVCDKALDLLDAHLQRLLDLAGRLPGMISQRQLGEVLGQTHAQAIQDVERGDMRCHRAGIQQHQSAQHARQSPDSPAADHRSGRRAAQQFRNNVVNSHIRDKEQHGAEHREHGGKHQQAPFLACNLQKACDIRLGLFVHRHCSPLLSEISGHHILL